MRPNGIQHIQHDKALNKKNFPLFAETFNYTVDRADNIKGDGDVDPQNGFVHVDNTNPEHPIIRLINTDKLGVGGHGGGGSGSIEPWDFNYEDNTIWNPEYQIGTMKSQAEVNVDVSALFDTVTNKTVYCKMDLESLSAEATLTPRDDPRYFSVPIWRLSVVEEDTGLSDENDQPIIEKIPIVSYVCRYPMAPIWEAYGI